MNDGKKEFDGGRTCFFGCEKAKGYKSGKIMMTSAVSASPGLALMFNQHPDRIEHNGEEVTRGVKYLMRTDVMYKLTDVKLDASERWKSGRC